MEYIDTHDDWDKDIDNTINIVTHKFNLDRYINRTCLEDLLNNYYKHVVLCNKVGACMGLKVNERDHKRVQKTCSEFCTEKTLI